MHSLKDVVCYGCGEKEHVKRRFPKQAEVQGQGNVSWRLDRQQIQSLVVALKGLISEYVNFQCRRMHGQLHLQRPL